MFKLMRVLADVLCSFIDAACEFSNGIAEDPDASLDELLVSVLRRLAGRDREIFRSVLRHFHIEKIRDTSCFEHLGIEI